jgi:hypothetical protein
MLRFMLQQRCSKKIAAGYELFRYRQADRRVAPIAAA